MATGSQLLASLSYFSGINNIDPPASLSYSKQDTPAGPRAVYPLQIAENVWIDNALHIHSRSDGQTLRIAGDIESLWSDGTTCLYVQTGSLYSMNKYYEQQHLLSGLAYRKRMSYATFNDRVYFSNGVNMGYVKYTNGSLAAHALTAPNMAFKTMLPAGKFIAVYRARLYVAVGKILFISDPLSECYDMRSGYRYFNSDINMVRPVENGIYVADNATWFLKGLAPEEFTRESVEDNSVIPYTDINVDDLKEGTKNGNWAMWTSSEGICIGDGNGNVTELTSHRFAMAEHVQGAAIIKDQDGVSQYINSMRQ